MTDDMRMAIEGILLEKPLEKIKDFRQKSYIPVRLPNRCPDFTTDPISYKPSRLINITIYDLLEYIEEIQIKKRNMD